MTVVAGTGDCIVYCPSNPRVSNYDIRVLKLGGGDPASDFKRGRSHYLISCCKIIMSPADYNYVVLINNRTVHCTSLPVLRVELTP